MKNKSSLVGLGIALGAALGIVYGVMAGNVGAWLAIGTAIGVAIGVSFRRREPACPECAAMHKTHEMRSTQQ
jgi:H+/Cl- antiporter ClcA